MLSTLTQRANLLAHTLTPDGGGGFAESWNAIADVWIALEIMSATDTVGADRLESRIRYHMMLRRRDDLVAGLRVQIGPRLFRVHAVLDGGPRDAFVTLQCEELP